MTGLSALPPEENDEDVAEFLKTLKQNLQQAGSPEPTVTDKAPFGHGPMHTAHRLTQSIRNVFNRLANVKTYKDYTELLQQIITACKGKTPEEIAHQLIHSVDNRYLSNVIDAIDRILDVIHERTGADAQIRGYLLR